MSFALTGTESSAMVYGMGNFNEEPSAGAGGFMVVADKYSFPVQLAGREVRYGHIPGGSQDFGQEEG